MYSHSFVVWLRICTLDVRYFSPQNWLNWLNVWYATLARYSSWLPVMTACELWIRQAIAYRSRWEQTNGQQVVRAELFKDLVAELAVGRRGVAEAGAIVEIPLRPLTTDTRNGGEGNDRTKETKNTPVSISSRSTPMLPALCFRCVANDTKSPKSAPSASRQPSILQPSPFSFLSEDDTHSFALLCDPPASRACPSARVSQEKGERRTENGAAMPADGDSPYGSR